MLRELLIRNLFNSGTAGHTLLYINNRLDKRQTLLDWEGNLMGLVDDKRGLEQGGVSSSDFYKIYGREQLVTVQESGLGVKLHDLTISGIGPTEDTVLISNNIMDFLYLLQLTMTICKK